MNQPIQGVLEEALAELAGRRVECDAKQLELVIRDRLAQKFGAYCLHENPEVAKAVSELWEKIFPKETA